MTDQEFIRGFEAGTLPAASFHHAQHIRAVWLYLRDYSLLETLERFPQSLKRFAAANGKPNLYHETITWAYALLIHERIRRHPEQQTWPEFVAANPDLFDWKNNILKSFYEADTLRSDLARQIFIFPDKKCRG
ncbi:MAG: hypothetical protein ABR607_07985 [Pyrinomonadaceae bacterium]